MADPELKLKQASIVLGVSPKDLQNLVQFGVVKPRLRERIFWFDKDELLRARVAFYLKDSLGSSTQVLAKFTEALFERAPGPGKRANVTFLSEPRPGDEPVRIQVPIRLLAQEIDERLPLANRRPDLPRGRKRPDWEEEFLSTLRAASEDLRDLSAEQILQAVRNERIRAKAVPKVSVLSAETKKAAARRR